MTTFPDPFRDSRLNLRPMNPLDQSTAQRLIVELRRLGVFIRNIYIALRCVRRGKCITGNQFDSCVQFNPTSTPALGNASSRWALVQGDPCAGDLFENVYRRPCSNACFRTGVETDGNIDSMVIEATIPVPGAQAAWLSNLPSRDFARKTAKKVSGNARQLCPIETLTRQRLPSMPPISVASAKFVKTPLERTERTLPTSVFHPQLVLRLPTDFCLGARTIAGGFVLLSGAFRDATRSVGTGVPTGTVRTRWTAQAALTLSGIRTIVDWEETAERSLAATNETSRLTSSQRPGQHGASPLAPG
jgi:hypothetical protein